MMLACRSCRATGLEPVLDLGSTPLANSLLRPEDLSSEEPRFPLQLAFCASCGLLHPDPKAAAKLHSMTTCRMTYTKNQGSR